MPSAIAAILDTPMHGQPRAPTKQIIVPAAATNAMEPFMRTATNARSEPATKPDTTQVGMQYDTHAPV